MPQLSVPGITLGTILKVVGILILTIGIVWYVLFQARSFLNGPVITLFDEPALVQQTRTIPVRGHAENIVTLTLNGREIDTTQDGAFNEQIVLEDGYSIMTLEARDRFGRSTRVTREHVFVPPPPQDVVIE